MSRSHTPKKTRVVVDFRERRSQAARILTSMDEVDVTFDHLLSGDYLVDRRLIVERKTYFDFALSVRDGRLFRQAIRLAQSRNQQPFLVIEGFKQRWLSLPIPRASVQGAIVSVTVVFGIPLIRTRDPSETVSVMLTAARQLGKRTPSPPRRRSHRAVTRRRLQSLMLQTITNIGPAKASSLLNELGNLRSVATASYDDFLQVPGIGPVIAKRLDWLFSERVDDEGSLRDANW